MAGSSWWTPCCGTCSPMLRSNWLATTWWSLVLVCRCWFLHWTSQCSFVLWLKTRCILISMLDGETVSSIHYTIRNTYILWYCLSIFYRFVSQAIWANQDLLRPEVWVLTNHASWWRLQLGVRKARKGVNHIIHVYTVNIKYLYIDIYVGTYIYMHIHDENFYSRITHCHSLFAVTWYWKEKKTPSLVWHGTPVRNHFWWPFSSWFCGVLSWRNSWRITRCEPSNELDVIFRHT